jgi:hypothetical protein
LSPVICVPATAQFHALLRSGWCKPSLFRSKRILNSSFNGLSCLLPAFSSHRSYLVIHRSRELPSSGFDALSNVIFDAAIFHLHRHPLNLRHVVVKNGLLAAIIPFDGHACPILFHCVVARKAFMTIVPFDGDVSRLNRCDLAAICRASLKQTRVQTFSCLDCSGVIS